MLIDIQMKKYKGFTLVEILIVVGVLGILAAGLLAAIDPFEQFKKSRDAVKRDISHSVYTAIINTIGQTGESPWSKDYIGLELTSVEGFSLIDYLIQRGELKSSTAQAEKLLRSIYATATINGSWVAVCFLPESKAVKASEAKYDTTGIAKENCGQNDCYVCVGLGQTTTTGGGTAPTPTSIGGDACANFDPEYPDFPWTCNYSTKWSKYGCTNYCVGDMGCGNGCLANERRLVKSYYINSSASDNCLNHGDITTEYYCVPAPEAGCEIMSYRSSPSDFVWGCTDPRRPKAWNR